MQNDCEEKENKNRKAYIPQTKSTTQSHRAKPTVHKNQTTNKQNTTLILEFNNTIQTITNTDTQPKKVRRIIALHVQEQVGVVEAKRTCMYARSLMIVGEWEVVAFLPGASKASCVVGRLSVFPAICAVQHGCCCCCYCYCCCCC